MTLLPSCSREPCVLAQAWMRLLFLLGLQKGLTTALSTSQAKKAAWLFLSQQLIYYAWLDQNRGASLLEEAPVATQDQCQMSGGCCEVAAHGEGSIPGTSWQRWWLLLCSMGWTIPAEGKLHGGKWCLRESSFLGRVRHEGEHSLSLLPTARSPPPQGHQEPHPLSPFLPERLAGLCVPFPRCQQPRMALLNCLPATTERNLRNMAHGHIVSKENLDCCPISNGFYGILYLPRCRLGGPCGASCPSAPAHCRAKLALRGTILCLSCPQILLLRQIPCGFPCPYRSQFSPQSGNTKRGALAVSGARKCRQKC